MKRILSYPGSKWRIAKQIIELIPQHHSYIEPFFGSGAILFNRPPSAIETINDLNSDVVNLFQCIQTNGDRLARLIATTPYARQVYERAWEVQSTHSYDKAAAFLIKCWQSYGYRTTKTGWKRDVQGREKAYTLRHWCDLPSVILQTAERLKLVQIECRSALELINTFDSPKVFMYLDPPYLFETRKASQKQYNYEMDNTDHIELLKAIKHSSAKIMISGYDSELYNSELSNWERVELKSNNNTGSITKEMLWMNYVREYSI